MVPKETGLDGVTVGDVDEVNLILLQNGVRAYEDDAGRQKIFRGTGYHSRAILNSGARIGYIVDYLKVVFVHTGFLWKRALQDENSHFAEDGDTPLTFWLFIDYFTQPSFDSPVTRTL
jgi:hypothetical protein